MRLDGETVALDDAFISVDEPDSPVLRVNAIRHLMPAKSVVERRSALWVYGALPRPPAVHEFCTQVGGNSRPDNRPRVRVREVMLREGDTTMVGGAPVTCPVRTAIDWARTTDDFGQGEAATLARLCAVHEITFDACVARLDRSHGIPNRIRALARLREACETVRAPGRESPAAEYGSLSLR